MSPRKKAEPRVITVAEIERTFELASYWWGERWCPAVHRNSNGYGIRVIRSITRSGVNESISYDYFELDDNGEITTAPRGYAKDFKPGQVGDIETWAERYGTPQADARRIIFGGES